MNEIKRKEFIQITKTVYVASDGIEFSTKAACEYHERELNATSTPPTTGAKKLIRYWRCFN